NVGDTARTQLTVNEPPLDASHATLDPIDAGQNLGPNPVTLATFTHGTVSESGITASINWGVSGHTADPGTVVDEGNGNYHVEGDSPTYDQPGSYTVTVTIYDDGVDNSVL